MPKLPITVFLVEDSPIALDIIKRILRTSPDIEIVGTANNGVSALKAIAQLQPDVVCTDLQMPKMDGLALAQQLMAKSPRPILVLSQAVQPEESETIAKLLQAGVVDVFPKPKVGILSEAEQERQALITKIKILSGVKVFKRPLSDLNEQTTSAMTASTPISVSPGKHPSRAQAGKFSFHIVAIGASTGGPQALNHVLSRLPRQFPLPVVCTQHISPGFLPGLVSWLDANCTLTVKIAIAGEQLLPGTVYFAPDHYHLSVNARGQVVYSSEPAFNRHRPSVTKMFEAMAQQYGAQVIGVLLTGMGQDGASGLKTLAQAGATTIAQNEASCVVFGMPKVAIDLGAAQHICAVEDIGALIVKTAMP